MDALLGIGIAVVAIAAAAGWSFWSRKQVMQPLAAMQAATRQLASGDFDARVAPVGNSNLDALGSDINKLADMMRAKLAEQQQVTNELRAASDAKVSKEYLERVVQSYSTFVDQVGQGNLAARITVDNNNDPLAQLGHRLNSMVGGLHAIAGQVQQANATLIKAATDMAALANQQAVHADKQLAVLAETTATVEKAKHISAQTAQQAAASTQATQDALRATQRGTDVVGQAVNAMSHIQERVDNITHTIVAVTEQTRAIGDISQTVTDLADQGNLLALNAAIEVARAGEQGRSFADATQRVCQFAERSKAAIEHVQAILRDIEQAAGTAQAAIEQGTDGVTHSAAQAGQAGQIITEIAQAVETGAQASKQVAAAAQQQTAGMDQIGQGIGAVQQVMTETRSSLQQAQQAAANVSTLAQSLQQAVAAYRL